MEWQCRNWLYFTWISGDHIVEQHVHNIDVINWAFGAHPSRPWAWAAAPPRTAPEYGNIFDHFAVEFEYPNGVRVMSMCRQTEGCAERVEEKLVGTKGYGLRLRRDQRRRALEVRGRRDEPLRAGAHRPDRRHPRRQAAQRGAPGRREHDVRDHGPDERLHRPGAELGLGDEQLAARLSSPKHSRSGPTRSTPWPSRARPRSSNSGDSIRNSRIPNGGRNTASSIEWRTA